MSIGELGGALGGVGGGIGTLAGSVERVGTATAGGIDNFRGFGMSQDELVNAVEPGVWY